jgi:hypothetical protein
MARIGGGLAAARRVEGVVRIDARFVMALSIRPLLGREADTPHSKRGPSGVAGLETTYTKFENQPVECTQTRRIEQAELRPIHHADNPLTKALLQYTTRGRTPQPTAVR